MMPSSAFSLNAPSLFDPENLHELDLLRKQVVAASATSIKPRTTPNAPAASAPADAIDRLFEQLKVTADVKDWHIGSVDIDIIHRGRIRIATAQWPPVIAYCKSELTESGIVKQFRLHVLRNAENITLVYGTYRFKQQISKTWQQDYHSGKLVDGRANLRETMVNLAYWLTAQPHAAKNYATWEALIDEAILKIAAVRAGD